MPITRVCTLFVLLQPLFCQEAKLRRLKVPGSLFAGLLMIDECKLGCLSCPGAKEPGQPPCNHNHRSHRAADKVALISPWLAFLIVLDPRLPLCELTVVRAFWLRPLSPRFSCMPAASSLKLGLNCSAIMRPCGPFSPASLTLTTNLLCNFLHHLFTDHPLPAFPHAFLSPTPECHNTCPYSGLRKHCLGFFIFTAHHSCIFYFLCSPLRTVTKHCQHQQHNTAVIDNTQGALRRSATRDTNPPARSRSLYSPTQSSTLLTQNSSRRAGIAARATPIRTID